MSEYVIHPCACGCDVLVKVPVERIEEYNFNTKWYASGHEPIGADWFKICPKYSEEDHDRP